MQKISETARGRWHGILPQLGISPKLLQNKHGPCPICGGKDRFRFDDKDGKGTWICNKCGSGEGAELVKRVKEVGFKEAAKMIEGVVTGVAKFDPPKQRPGADKEKMNRMWLEESKRITRSDPVGSYLAARCGIESNYSGDLRCWGECIMLARVRDGEGVPVTIHRTIIEDGKADKKLLMPGKLPDNVAIRLGHWYGGAWGELGIAEGIETALSASVLFNVPVWAAISAPLLKKWRPPAGVVKVIIFGDNDKNYTGQEAAYSLARSLSGDLEVDIKIPTLPGQDWNDVHRDIMSKA
jgi:putative DNA primase/helicase